MKCPHCGAVVKAWENGPAIYYTGCAHVIGFRVPELEPVFSEAAGKERQ